MIVSAVAPTFGSAQGGPPDRVPLLVGLHSLGPEHGAGESFHGAEVRSVNADVRFIIVEAASPAQFRERAQRDANVRYVEDDENVRWIQEVPPPSATPSGSSSEEPGELYTPNDPSYAAQQYGPKELRAYETAWDTTLGNSNAKVCIVDSGVRYTHEEFAGRWLGGWNYVHGTNNPWDDTGHGTHVAGVAAAWVNNGKGIAGMANVGIYGVKVLDSSGSGSFSNVANGITWCANNAGARTVINLSLGCRGCFSQAVYDAVTYAFGTRGQLVVAAAGNDACTNCVSFPANHPYSIAVSCTTAQRALCWFSSTGPEISVAAPGENILSTWYTADNAYATASGTSMSAPHVAGAAALYWSWDTGISNVNLYHRVRGTAADIGAAGNDNQFGFGLANVKCMFLFILCKPGNDLFSSSTPVGGTFYWVGFDTLGAQLESGEPQNCDNSGTVWFHYTAPNNGILTVDTFQSQFDTVLAAYTGAGLTSLSPVTCNDQFQGDQSQISFNTVAGVTYRIQAGGWKFTTLNTGHMWFRLQHRPINDHFGDAVILGANPVQHVQGTVGATTEDSEGLPCGMGGGTIWYRYTPAMSGTVVVDTFGSNYDTVLAVYTSSLVACNDNTNGAQSYATFTATAGTTYYFQVGGVGGQTGNVILNVGRPTITAACPAAVTLGEPTTCTFTGQAFDGNLHYIVDWGDGTTTRVPASGSVAPGIQQSASRTYGSLGTRIVTLTAYNSMGMGSLPQTRTVQVLQDATPPEITVAAPLVGRAHHGCTFAATLPTNTRPLYVDRGCIAATITDPQSGLAQVRFLYGGQVMASWTSPSQSFFQVQWDLASGPALTVPVVLEATNGAGGTTTITELVNVVG
jgi:hypothetical protein